MTAVNQYFDQLATWTGLDPIFIIALGGISSAGVGWLSGPVLGSAVFRMFHRRVHGDMAVVSSGLLFEAPVRGGLIRGCYRKKRTSSLGLRSIALILPASRCRTLYPITMGRRLGVLRSIGIG